MFSKKTDGRVVREKLISSFGGRYSFSADVRNAFLETDRAHYVVKGQESQAHKDRPLPLPCGQTISAMHMVLMMLSEELARPRPSEAALDVGTGSGYAAAVLARSLGAGIEGNPPVRSVELIKDLAALGKRNLEDDGLADQVSVIAGDAVSIFRDFLYP